MNCYYCGAKLNDRSTCPNCNADVRVWKKAVSISNILYNDGLEKAGVRDLSNAVTSLQLSLQYNKMNVQARNLLGLVYYEQGEIVSALSEWVISKSFQPENNNATEYLNAIQSEAYLDEVGQTVKKYNQALVYCQQEAYDLAILQLKQVVGAKPGMIKAQQLLALLYMNEKRYDLAAKILKKCSRIDTNNTDTLRYIKECKKHLRMNGKVKAEPVDEPVTYTSGNDIIIRPSKFSDNHIAMTVINMLIGLGIGIALMLLLVFPAVKQSANDKIVTSTVESNESLTTKEQTIDSLNNRIEELEGQLNDANATITVDQDTISAYKDLARAVNYYAINYYSDASNILDGINKELLDEDAVKAYDSMYNNMKDSILLNNWNEGLEIYTNRDYPTAIEKMRKCVAIDPSYRNGEVCFYLAFAYFYSGDKEHAYEFYQKTVQYTTDASMKSQSQDMCDMYKAQGITPAED